MKVDDKFGVVFEMLDCDSLKNAIVNHPENYDEYVKKYAELLKKMNSTECYSSIVPPIKKDYYKKLNNIKDQLSEDLYNKAHHLLDSIPERNTLVHGDCHFKNIMLQSNELVLIDMETLSIGHPIFELAGLYSAYIGFNEFNPEESMEFFGVSNEEVQKLFHSLMNNYFPNYNEEIKDKISLVSYINVYRWYFAHKPSSDVVNKYKEKLVNLLNKYNDLDIGV